MKDGTKDQLINQPVEMRRQIIESEASETERKQAEEVLQESEKEYKTLIENSLTGIFIHQDGKYVFVNDRFAEIHGYKPEELLGKEYLTLIHPDDREVLRQIASKRLKGEAVPQQYEVRGLRKDGMTIWCEVMATSIQYRGRPAIMGNIIDITRRKWAEKRVKYLSLHDSLTGLYNRAYFEEEMKRLNTIRKYPVGIIMVDIDNLKFINDAFGHPKGDELLKRLANILSSISRKEDVVARIGGDEFAVILPNVDEKTVQSFCKRITNACEDRNRESSLKLSVSLGYGIQHGQYKDIQGALKAADDSMYKDKLVSRTTVQKNTIDSLMIMLAQRDPHTEKHGEELQELAVSIGRDAGIPEHRLKHLRLLALLHDIGKVSIPDLILYKSDKLSPEEWETMKRHCETGYRIAKNVPELVPIAEDILSHHEWWNGKGYPKGLKGEETPILARIISIVDAYNTIQSERPYKKARSKEEAIKELKRCAGTQFDPELVQRFLKIVIGTNADSWIINC